MSNAKEDRIRAKNDFLAIVGTEKAKMPKRIKDQWVKALRSGEYEQGSSVLCSHRAGGDVFCCLGVLADIAVDGEWVPSGDSCFYTLEGANVYEECYLGPEGEKLGLGKKLQEHLGVLNDNFGFSFDEIADLVEKHL